MSELIMEVVKDNTKTHKIELLRTMLNDVEECFDNYSAQQQFEIKNFIESYIHEINE